MQNQNINTTQELTLYGLFSLFLKNWLILAVCGFSFAVGTLIWVINVPDVYKAEALLMPTNDESGNLSGLSGSLGGLAAMAGVSLPEGKNNNVKLAIELMKSEIFLTQFISENNLLVPLMASEGWDPVENRLLVNEEIYNTKTKEWVRSAPPSRKQIPSLQETYEELLKLISIEQDPKSKFTKVSVEFYSPSLAAEWTMKLVKTINSEIRERDKKEASESIDYLKKLAVDANVYGLRTTFSSLMEEQIKSQMLAEIRKDYVFKIVDPATAPELKSKPRRSIIVVVAGFLGGIVGIAIVLFRSSRKSYLASIAD